MFRFWLLVAAVVGTVPFLAAPYGYLLTPGAAEASDRSTECVRRIIAETSAAARPGTPVDDRLLTAAERITQACERTSQVRLGLYALGVVVLVLVVAAAIYRWLPDWRVRRRRLVDVRALPEVHARLASLAEEAGVERVSFLLDPFDPRPTGLAFGRVGRRRVVLSAGLVSLSSREPELFRAVILHELAHVRNGDLDPTYLAVAVWRAYAALVLAPAALAVLFIPGHRLALSWRVAGVALLVYLIRNGVLRTREHYADIRVDRWRAGDGLRRILGQGLTVTPHAAERTVAGTTADRWRALRHRVGLLLRHHPDPRARLAVLADPGRLLVPGFGDGLALGVTATLGHGTLTLWLDWLLAADTRPSWLQLLPFTPPLAYVLTLMAVRTVTAARLIDRRPSLRRLGLGLGMGLLLAVVITPQGGVQPVDSPIAGGSRLAPGAWLLWGGVVVLGSMLLTGWLVTVAQMWLPWLSSRRHPARWALLPAAGTALLLTTGLAYALNLPIFTNMTAQLVFPELPQVVVLIVIMVSYPLLAPLPLLLALFVVAWAVPMIGGAPGMREASPRPRISPDELPPGLRWRALPTDPSWTLLITLAATMACLQATTFLYAGVGLTIPPGGPNGAQVLLTGVSMMTVGVLAQLLAAGAAFAAAPAARAAHALLAAFLAYLPTSAAAGMALSTIACLTGGGCTRLRLLPGSLLLLGWQVGLLVSTGLVLLLVGLQTLVGGRGQPSATGRAA